MDAAIEAFTESLELARETHYLIGEARQLDNLAEVYFAVGRTREAIEAGSQAYSKACELNAPRERCFHGLTLGWALILDNQFAEARVVLADASVQPVRHRHHALVALGIAHFRLEAFAAARSPFEQAEQQATALVIKHTTLYKAWLTIGLARAGLALLDETPFQGVLDAYQQAMAVAPHVGVYARQRLLLEALTPIDHSNVLAPLHALLRAG